jgi:hypothetical protein
VDYRTPPEKVHFMYLNTLKAKVKGRCRSMEVVLEQFIPSDKPKKISDILKKISIGLWVGAITVMFGSFIIGLAFGLLGLVFFIGSYLMYIDYEYELYNGNITITKVYNASRRRVAQKIEREAVRRVYLTEGKDILKKGVTAYYNTNLGGLKIYTFELNNNKVIQLALKEDLEKIVKIVYAQDMTY